ncbi:MAG: alpha/beta hydrolase [Alcanivoracaceae bacterium]|nr:alpha/beta hydrolase [Alcanivoracaceae bacterium]
MPSITLRDGEMVHVRTIGRGKPVVLVHGFASNSSHWLPNVLPLAHRYRFIMPDLRGFGRSSTAQITDHNVFEQYARDLHDVLDHFQLDQTALGGISTGAYICLTYNRMFGFDRVNKYLNIEHTPESRIRDDWQHGLFSEKQDELFSCFQRLLEMAEEAGPDTPYWSLPEPVRREFSLTMTRVLSRALNNSVARGVARFAGQYAERLLAGTVFPVENWYAYIQVMRAFMNGNDTRAELANIKVPTTLMIGAHSRFFSTDGQLEIQRHVPHAKVVTFERSGHIPMLDQPVRFQREFARFLAQ